MNSRSRLKLHQILVEALGVNRVYFQPPETIKMDYPCIVYSRINTDDKFANNGLYLQKKRYSVKVIAKDPDSATPDKIARLPLCSFDRHYTADNLNHDVYNIYY